MTQTVILSELDREIAFNRKWRRITAAGYFTGASLSVMAAAAATVIAGLGYATPAAIAAAVATVCTSLEKVLLFRGKWTHHRVVESELDLVRWAYKAGTIDEKGVLKRFEDITRFYAGGVPLANDSGRTA